MKKIYIGTLLPVDSNLTEGLPHGSPLPGLTTDKAILADNIAEMESIIGDMFTIERFVNVENWVLSNDNTEGQFYMADVKFLNEVTAEIDSIQFFVKAKSLTEVEEIVKKECGDSFEFILSAEKSPYEVLEG